MKPNALQRKKRPLLKTGCIPNNQNKTTIGPQKWSKGSIFRGGGGGGGADGVFTQPMYNHGNLKLTVFVRP